jgi:hypothetical protein
MIATMSAQDSAEGIQAIVALNYAMFEAPVARLLAEKKVKPVLGVDILAQQFARSVASALQHRLIERGSEARLAQEIELGLILVTTGLAPAAERATLLDRARGIGQAIG